MRAVVHADGRLTVSTEPCELHKNHSPSNHTIEFHHLVPVAWQLAWQPSTPPPSPGPDPDGRGELWDNRGAWLCPTGHRNVHYWIVSMMRKTSEHEHYDWSDTTEIPSDATTEMARLALERFTAVGGSLLLLANKGQWGQS